MYIMDNNIHFSTKKEIINNFPIESTHPPCSTHGGSFEHPNTLGAYIWYSRRCGDETLAFSPLSYLWKQCISRKNDRISCIQKIIKICTSALPHFRVRPRNWSFSRPWNPLFFLFLRDESRKQNVCNSERYVLMPGLDYPVRILTRYWRFRNGVVKG